MDGTGSISQIINRVREIERHVPTVLDEAILILVAHYVKRGSLSVLDAARISGRSESDIQHILSGSTKRPQHWASLARAIGNKKTEVKRGFKSWVRDHLKMNPEYVYRLLKAEREFGGCEVKKMALGRVFMLFGLAPDQKETIKTKGVLEVDGQSYTINELNAMKAIEFRRLARKATKNQLV